MTELLTSAQMRAIEQAAITSGQVTGLELMERAGARVVEAILEEWPELGPGSGVTVLCGPGNNGGDGFVVARLLADRRMRVRLLAVPSLRRSADAREVRLRWKRARGRSHVFSYEMFRRGRTDRIDHGSGDADHFGDLYVDAVLGTGTRGPMTGEVGEALAYMAGSGGDAGYFRPRTVAVDLPSGLDADSGEVPGHPRGRADPPNCGVPAARLTVTFDSPKLGHVLGLGPAICGKLVVADIGLGKWRALDTKGSIRPERVRLVTGPDLAADNSGLARLERVPDLRRSIGMDGFWPLKKGWAGHKYVHGHALVLTGDFGRTGAARLAARAALRSGAGLVTLAAPSAAMPECAAQITALMLRRCDGSEDLAALLQDRRINGVCLGPGLGLGEATQSLVAAALGAGRGVVLDADALTAFVEAPDVLFDLCHDKVVMTPHDGEFARLFPDLAARMSGPKEPRMSGNDPAGLSDFMRESTAYRAEMAAERAPLYSKLDAVRDAAERAGCTVLLKGEATVIAEPKLWTAVHLAAYDRAAPWLATAGSGDVLAGMIAGLLARGLPPLRAAETAAWLHVEAARSFGPGLIAEDLPEQLPMVFRNLGA